MEKEIKINVPDGYVIDKENSTFECIKFKSIVKNLPKTWEEFCKTHSRREGEAWITQESKIDTFNDIIATGYSRDPDEDRNLLPNQLYAKAMLALCQLIQLRDYYNDGWMPKWNSNKIKYCIEIGADYIHTFEYKNSPRVLTFKSSTLRDTFLTNFKDLIEVAKPLL